MSLYKGHFFSYLVIKNSIAGQFAANKAISPETTPMNAEVESAFMGANWRPEKSLQSW